jgi:hypothetical protein
MTVTMSAAAHSPKITDIEDPGPKLRFLKVPYSKLASPKLASPKLAIHRAAISSRCADRVAHPQPSGSVEQKAKDYYEEANRR